jgi:hypothetical protein
MLAACVPSITTSRIGLTLRNVSGGAGLFSAGGVWQSMTEILGFFDMEPRLSTGTVPLPFYTIFLLLM